MRATQAARQNICEDNLNFMVALRHKATFVISSAHPSLVLSHPLSSSSSLLNFSASALIRLTFANCPTVVC